jgi:hypothetical protein
MPNVLIARRTAAVNRLRAVSQNGKLRPEAEQAHGAQTSDMRRRKESTSRV